MEGIVEAERLAWTQGLVRMRFTVMDGILSGPVAELFGIPVYSLTGSYTVRLLKIDILLATKIAYPDLSALTT